MSRTGSERRQYLIRGARPTDRSMARSMPSPTDRSIAACLAAQVFFTPQAVAAAMTPVHDATRPDADFSIVHDLANIGLPDRTIVIIVILSFFMPEIIDDCTRLISNKSKHFFP